MKKLLIALILVACSSAYAGNDARSMRTPDGKVISLGDSRQTVIDGFRRDKPISVRDYIYRNGRVVANATDYIYSVGNSVYTITVVNEAVYRISWVGR